MSMREHKYRLWNEAEKRLVYFNLRNLVGHWSGDVFDFENQERVAHEPSIGETTLISQAPLMQYTGLHDSTPWEKATPNQREGHTKETWQGVEIYEGDVVKYAANGIYPSISYQWFTKEVKFENGQFYPLPGQDLRGYPNLPMEFFEVIGNIYESPEPIKAGNA